MQNQTVAEISLAALRSNYRTLAALAAPGRLLPVVKANAYGHGALSAARCLAAEGAELFAVVTLNEALELRAAGFRQDLLVMGVVDAARAGEAARRQVTITLHGAEHARDCESAVRAADLRLNCHLKIDTGMSRLGLPWRSAAAVLGQFKCSPWLDVQGLMTHLAGADDADLAGAELQLANFQAVVKELERLELRPAICHVANSAALMRMPRARLEMSRAGIALYGAHPCQSLAHEVGLRGVMTLRTVIALTREVPRGDGVSYNHRWRAGRDSRIAVLPIGYADGYRRAFSNRAQVRIDGCLAPVVGTVCMDATLVDITDLPSARVGTPVTLMESDPRSPLSVSALADLAGTISYEILTGIGPRVRRVDVE